MRRKQKYYRTAALLGAQPQHAALPARRQRPRWKLHISWKVAVPALVVALFLGWLGLARQWYVTMERLQVSGASSTALAREIALASELLDSHGLLLRESATAEMLLERHAGLVAVQVDCQRFPAACVIHVEERTPVLAWFAGDQLYWIDAEGVVFAAYESQPELPQVHGPLPDSPYRLMAAMRGVEALMDLGVPADELEYNPERGLVWSDEEGRRVAFGVGATMQPRWDIYLALSAHLEARQIFPWAIDVRFPGGPTYSLERTW